MIENTILKANREGRKALVLSMTYKDLWAVEAAAQAGFDAVSLDGEQRHGGQHWSAGVDIRRGQHFRRRAQAPAPTCTKVPASRGAPRRARR